MERIALIAHDRKKDDLVDFVKNHRNFFEKYDLVSTGTTGGRINQATDLEIHRYLSGPLGGDQQIGSDIAMGKIKAVFFFRDPLQAQPHEPDIQALVRLCDVHQIPVATNVGTAELIIKAMKD
ncbi:MAG: methylglyoxal synthase [Fusobacteriaceae bacterium]|jgi:methylglyoxal synthase|nr:methylglyoxal synthase [Fusobacteriaceae bacterium]MBP6467694.1 methylglyoxal synthase [Fusobacteriaceae bacterium]MBP9596044.1 methylglyoxal synthase [Fusobacteriaceae bacterium]MBU9918214.1 methylglyoxal synthase [Fusobacteriaceae bacterium]